MTNSSKTKKVEEFLDVLEQGQPMETTTDKPTLKIEVDPTGGEVSGLMLPNPLAPDEYEDAFQKVYKLAGLDPKEYRIVDDTVRFSVWQQSAKPKGAAKRDLITLYSYRARFRRISEVDERTEKVLNDLAEHMKARRDLTIRRTPGTGLGAPVSFTALPSDWQLGKNEIRVQDLAHGKTGVEQTTWRIERFLDRSAKRIEAYRKTGVNLQGVSIGFMGDAIENVADSYSNQEFIIEMGLNDQIIKALDLMALVCEELLPLADGPQQVFAVLCNHGQLSRRGTKTNVTDDSDNAQNLLMRLLRDRVIGPIMPGVEWYLPGQEMITTLDIAGVPVAASHGHKIPSSGKAEETWLAKQSNLLRRTRGHDPRLWLTAHRHSHDSTDYGPYTRLQAATADGGSKYFQDSNAVYSVPGTSTLLIGNHDESGYTDFQRL